LVRIEYVLRVGAVGVFRARTVTALTSHPGPAALFVGFEQVMRILFKRLRDCIVAGRAFFRAGITVRKRGLPVTGGRRAPHEHGSRKSKATSCTVRARSLIA